MEPVIMIVDDAMFMRRLIRNMLEKGGFRQLVEVEDSRQALALFKNSRPDLVLLDITMPNKSGLEVLDELLTEDPQANVIMCSAVGQDPIIAQAIRRGAKNFVVKPFKQEELLKLVEASICVR